MNGKKLTELEYINRCKKVNPQYNYSKIGFTKLSGFVTPICKKHGLFKINAKGLTDHFIECPECNREKRFKQFVEKARIIHGNKYEYDLKSYLTNKKPTKIICPEHGEFLQAPGDHLKGYGCSKCSKKYKPTTLEWINKVSPIYNNKYDYSKVEYRDNKTKVTIICPKHGEFKILPNNHITGKSGCPKCAAELRHTRYKKSTKLFVEDAIKIHGDRYDYSKVNYYNKVSKVTIICPVHGEFLQIPNSHLQGSGCPACANKNQGLIYKKVKEAFSEYKFISEYNDTWLGLLRLDIYCPEHNFGIEYDGELHFYPIKYFGGEEYFNVLTQRDEIKNKKCLNQHCKLFRIKYNYIDKDIEELISNISEYILNKDEFIPKLREGSCITII